MTVTRQAKTKVRQHRLLTTMQTAQMTAPLIQRTAIHRQAVVGTWTVTALEGTEGTAVSIDDYATANGVDPETLKCTYTFADDGTFSGEMSGVTVSGNYTFEGTDLVMTVGEQQFNYTYDADNDMLKYTDPNTGLSSYCERQQ